MARLSFEGLPSFSYLGGPIAGTMVLETDAPMRARDVTLALRGREVSQTTVSTGKSSQTLTETASFLDLEYSFHDKLPFADPDHLPAGTYRLPFTLAVPVTATPSIHTLSLAVERGRFFTRPDGLYVEYILEAKVDVPWWLADIDRVLVPVYSPRRVLGAVPLVASPAASDHASLSVAVDQPMLLPGNVVTGSYSVANPKGKELRSLALTLRRFIHYQVRGYQRAFNGPTYSTTIPFERRGPAFQGTFQISVPNAEDTTGPWQGQLFQTYWIFAAHLDVHLGFSVDAEIPLRPA